MSFTTRDGKTHQSSVLMSESGLPIDGIATIAGSYVFLEGNAVLNYQSGSATVTLPPGNDLTPVTTAKARYTGKYVLISAEGTIYYIERQSIDVPSRTFKISRSDKAQVTPASIDTSAGWVIAEADIVNRLATTSSAKVDNIEFRDMHFQFELDGDPVTVRGENGNTLEPNADGSINVVDNKTAARTPTILNTNLELVGTEYEIDIPVTVKKFTLRSRESSILELAYAPSSPTNIRLKPGQSYSEDGLSLTMMLTIYIKSNKPNTVIETVYWE